MQAAAAPAHVPAPVPAPAQGPVRVAAVAAAVDNLAGEASWGDDDNDHDDPMEGVVYARNGVPVWPRISVDSDSEYEDDDVVDDLDGEIMVCRPLVLLLIARPQGYKSKRSHAQDVDVPPTDAAARAEPPVLNAVHRDQTLDLVCSAAVCFCVLARHAFYAACSHCRSLLLP